MYSLFLYVCVCHRTRTRVCVGVCVCVCMYACMQISCTVLNSGNEQIDDKVADTNLTNK